MSDKDRRSTLNGIWLCQNCAKLIDSDVETYTLKLLAGWKAAAEGEARARIGQTNPKHRVRSVKQAVAALQRDHKIRDDLHRDLLKSARELMALPRQRSRTSKFAHSEIIVHSIDDRSYPNIDKGPGISGWFKLEILDFYYGGLDCVLGIEWGLHDTKTRAWSLISYEHSQLPFPDRFSKGNVFITGRIPWRNILYYDMHGDQYYPFPHLYCAFVDSGEPYEGRGYFLTGDGESYQWELQIEDRVEVETLLKLADQEEP